MAIRFIPDELVLPLHTDLLKRYGGQSGVRDENLLLSALAQPKMTVGGKYVHKTIFDMAAVYGFHVCRNHPFIDGNKRIAFVLMDIFLQMNYYTIISTEEEAFSIMIALASGECTKTELALWLQENTTKFK